jgi:DNA-binding transcriptional MocR family regulator
MPCATAHSPGERLTQENIAARLNVSRQPVTHALAVLKAQGFLAQGRQGLTVTAVDPDFFEGDLPDPLGGRAACGEAGDAAPDKRNDRARPRC